jgi:hypothetical protein
MRMAKTPDTDIDTGKDVEEWELIFIDGGNGKRCSHLGRDFGGFLQNLT